MGETTDVMYVSAGGSDDWAYDVMLVSQGYTNLYFSLAGNNLEMLFPSLYIPHFLRNNIVQDKIR